MAKAKTEYTCPLTVNYVELYAIIGDADLVAYIGDNLPSEEVERIVTDFNIYKQNKK